MNHRLHELLSVRGNERKLVTVHIWLKAVLYKKSRQRNSSVKLNTDTGCNPSPERMLQRLACSVTMQNPQESNIKNEKPKCSVKIVHKICAKKEIVRTVNKIHNECTPGHGDSWSGRFVLGVRIMT